MVGIFDLHNTLPTSGKIECRVSRFKSDAFEMRTLNYQIVMEPHHCTVAQLRKNDNDTVLPDIGLQYVFRLLTGPTGFEAFYITKSNLLMMYRVGWEACHGSHGYDRCFISADEIKRCLSLFMEVLT